MRRSTLPFIIAVSLLAGVACAKGGAPSGGPDDEDRWVGYDDPSSADMAAIQPALEDGDLAGVVARGLTIWRMRRAMRLGDRAFAGFVGVTAAKFVAIPMIDPGGASGQVAYYRWDDGDLDDGQASAGEARNWVVVPLTIDPDEALEPVELGGKPDAEQRRVIAAMLLTQASANAKHAEGRWVSYAFREQVMANGAATGQRQTRIYMIGADENSPDIEYTILDQIKRKQALTIARERVQLVAGAAGKLPLSTPERGVGPSTVARAVEIATATKKPVQIVDGAGGKWEVAPNTAALTRL
ncbi:hypothetical protein DB30_06233 [Enhygromyxa salina]|uniref:Lipoprotein n=1 Tax=Enhygromyxa salina TaxID=215803 RepID=A0A0C2CUY0_9BACT|nr:hypothetical protein [Enhygromyxa salina]KIG14931.1 hypothetical protein DB30_06233 [Enhygromyxa salina]